MAISNHARLRKAHMCPVEAGIALLSGRWKARILWKLYNRTMRFGELRRALPGITEKMLAQQLRELEHDELVTRTMYPEMPPRVEYSLSTFGRTLEPVLQMLATWGTDNHERIAGIINRDESPVATE
ncbi:MAG: winged helix-turn-helix transcriptional regulator [Chloroflexi bacterium]|nr:winged helix-turn-helix transcriptional regulator [Chloroflexota bacterium]